MNLKALTSFVILITLLCVQSISQWQQSSMTNGTVSSLASNSNYVYVCNDGLYYTTGHFAIWIYANLTPVDNVTVSGNYIYASAWGSQLDIYRSTNNGSNWTLHRGGAADGIWSIASYNSKVYVGRVHYGIGISKNNGESWGNANITGTIHSIAVNDNLMIVGRNNTGLYRSSNHGVNWTNSSVPSYVITIRISGNYIFAGTESSGVYVSTNSGVSWTQSTLNNQKVWSIEAVGNNVFAGTNLNGVYVSNDNGVTWVQRNEGLTNLSVTALTIKGNDLYAGTDGAGVWWRNLSQMTGVNQISSEIPQQYNLYQNYPNPFNPSTKIKFAVPKQNNVMLNIYSSNGEFVQTLVNQNLTAGTYEADFNGAGLASGVYFYTLESDYFKHTKKMVLIK